MQPWLRILSLLFGLLCSALAQEDILRPRGAPIMASPHERALPIMLGIEGALNWNTASQTLQYSPFQPTNTPTQLFKSGSGFSPAVRVLADIGLSPALGFQLHVGYDVKTWGRSGTAEADCQNLLNPTLVTVIPVSVDWTFTAEYLTAGAGLRYAVTPHLWLTGGVTAHFHRSNRQKTTYSASQDANCGFPGPDGQLYRTLQIEAEFDSPPIKSTRFGVELGAGYVVPIAHRLWLVPRLQFQLLSSFRDDLDGTDAWKPYTEGPANVRGRNASQYSLQLLVGLWFGL